ncbi:putative N-acetylglucosamine-1-phosphodiester alpha-N-acetylglucosaminidase isoform X4 [Apostichopus japonicus]|uniref:Putative N-acetylglucosamine-1-phosphodiester alpha-N-acetylglucosaminidase isoform X4 n=1 Tax=Stichopus japonicus TaxID=307972 RepID=A0A2G8L9Z2_STIJA|nr:putative N-acetylglucosamine-1-phosphodiester alpha-N-acetylglucosaminidase isoform X4 [Apostichopus japonicus]
MSPWLERVLLHRTLCSWFTGIILCRKLLLGHGFCDEPNNRCLCLDGYTGQNCSEKCPNGFFGRDCIQKCVCPFCDHITGSCETCPHGYQGDGCKGTCNLEQWGPNCNSSCTCANDATCDVFTGICKETSTKKYEDSEDQDSMDIDLSSESESESKSESPDDSDDSTISIVILAVSNLCGILAIVSFIGILACVCSKRRRDRKKTYRENPPEPKIVNTISKTIDEEPPDTSYQALNLGNIADPPDDRNSSSCYEYLEIDPIPGPEPEPEPDGYMSLRPDARIDG